MESAENRYAHLLQPIRELAKNWDIDVASELGDYLDELDEIGITFDGGQIRLNFAEAALLIQGSAFIYSKKVELLYSLVYQTMDYINQNNNRREKQKRASDKEDGDDVAADDDDDDDCDFMCQEMDSSGSDKSNERDSLTLVYAVPPPPEALIPPDSREKLRLPLISVKGEVLGSHKDFRMNTHVPGPDDLIRLMHDSVAEGNNTGLHSQLAQPPQRPVDTVEPGAPENQVAVGDDDGGDGGGDDDFMPLQDVGEEMDCAADEHIDRQQAPSGGRVLRGVQPEKEKEQLEGKGWLARADMWQQHDLYDVYGEVKPLKTGKFYKVPNGLDDGGKRKRKRPNALPDFRTWFTGLFDAPEHKLKSGPSSTDLNYIYLSKVKEKMKNRKRIHSKVGVQVSDEELRRTLLQPEAGALGGEEENNLEGDRHPDLQGDDDDGSDNDHEPLLDVELSDAHDFMTAGCHGDDLSYEELVRRNVEQFLVNSKGYAQETDLSRRVKDWEDKLRPELLLQEDRPVFDIHDYSDRIVAAMGAVGRHRSLASIVHGMENFEACKYMLASLQLANDYTVEISSQGTLEDSIDTMGLTLLTTHRATERFKTLGTL